MQERFVAELYETRYTLFFAKALGIVRDIDTAHDIVHDACLRVLEMELGINSIEHCKALIIKCTNFCAIDHVRKAQTKREAYPKVMPVVADFSHEDDAQSFTDKPLFDLVAKKAELNEKELELLALLRNGYKIGEISKQLGLDPRQITNLKYRVMEKLKNAISKRVHNDIL